MDPTSIISILLMLALVGFVCWLIITYIPMPDPFKQVIVVVMIVLLISLLLAYLHGGKAIHLV